MFAVYVICPDLRRASSSRSTTGTGWAPKDWIGWRNYAELWTDRAFIVSLKNNVIWLVLYLLAVPAGLCIAIFLNQTVTGIRIYKSLFFFPFVISQVVVGLIFSWFYAPDFGLFYTC